MATPRGWTSAFGNKRRSLQSMLAGLDGRKLSEQKYQPLTTMCIGCGTETPAICRWLARNRSSIWGSPQLANSGVSGSPSHSPSRMWRAQAPGSGISHATGSGRAVIGRAWNRSSSPPTSAHSMSWGTPPKCASTRSSECCYSERLVRINGPFPRSPAYGFLVTDNPFVRRRLAGNQPLARTTGQR